MLIADQTDMKLQTTAGMSKHLSFCSNLLSCTNINTFDMLLQKEKVSFGIRSLLNEGELVEVGLQIAILNPICHLKIQFYVPKTIQCFFYNGVWLDLMVGNRLSEKIEMYKHACNDVFHFLILNNSYG